MLRRRYPNLRPTPLGFARSEVVAFFDADGKPTDDRSVATRYVRGLFGEDEGFLGDERGPIAEYAETDVPVVGPAPDWTGVLAVEGNATGDGRMMLPDSLRWDTPMPLRFVRSDSGAHDGAVTVGTITAVRREGGNIVGEGTLDYGSADGREAARLLGEGIQTGVSVDLDDVTVSVRLAAELAAEWDEMMVLGEGEEPEREVDEEGRVVVMRFGADDELLVTEDGRIRAATLVAVPAFAEANLALTDDGRARLGSDPVALVAAAAGTVEVGMTVSWTDDDGEEREGEVTAVDDEAETVTVGGETLPVADVTVVPDEDDGEGESADGPPLLAAAPPSLPSVDAFGDPRLGGPTPLTVDEDGRVYGHLATWGTCHTAYAECVSPPRTGADYAYFHVGSVAALADDGSEALVPVGRITLGGGHADPRAGFRAATSHYDETGSAVAFVRAGEDDYGIWVSGVLGEGVTDEQVRELRASPLSGDWRNIGGTLELVAALAVNVPGFPIPHPKAVVASGRVESLVAAGMVADRGLVGRTGTAEFDPDDLAFLRRLAARDRRERAAALRRKVKGDDASLVASLSARIHNEKEQD